MTIREIIFKNMALSVWPYYSIHFFYLISYICLTQFKNAWCFIFVGYGLIPLVDLIIPLDDVNPSKEELKKLH